MPRRGLRPTRTGPPDRRPWHGRRRAQPSRTRAIAPASPSSTRAVRPRVKTVVRSSIVLPRTNSSGAMKRREPSCRSASRRGEQRWHESGVWQSPDAVGTRGHGSRRTGARYARLVSASLPCQVVRCPNRRNCWGRRERGGSQTDISDCGISRDVHPASWLGPGAPPAARRDRCTERPADSVHPSRTECVPAPDGADERAGWGGSAKWGGRSACDA
jgi:hypothetical protein